MKICELSPRLKRISELIENSNVTADIGTDHAYLPAVLLAAGKTRFAIASDIRKGPIERARRTIRKYGLEDRVSLRLGAGLSTIVPDDNVDTIVISGMGGLNIAEILSGSAYIAAKARLVIMQPMSMQAELREFLYGGSFKDIREYLVREGDKLYNIISAVPGEETHSPLTEGEKLAGRYILRTKPPEFHEYITRLCAALKKKKDGLSRSSSADMTEVQHEIQKIDSALSELSKYIK